MNHTTKRSRLTHARVAACVALGLAGGVASAQTTASSATGWRGNGSGRYPDAAPPLHWGRSSPAFDAVRWQADGPRGGAATGTSLADGVTRRWLVLGPVERPTTPEATAAADATAAAWQPAAGDTFGALAWKAADTEGALLALGDVFGAASNACAYACVYLNAPEAVTVALNLLHSSDVAIWLGGRRIHASNNGTTSCMVRLALQPGWNRLLVRTARGKGWFDKENWFLYAAFFPIEAPQAANLGWTLPYGGAAAPIVVGDRLLLQGGTSDLLALDRDSGRTDWVRAVDYYHATPQAQRQAAGFAEAGRIAAEIDQLNASLSGAVGLTAEQQKVKEELLKRLYECMRVIDPAAYTYTKEQDLGMAGFVPVSDGRHVWAWYASGIAACFDLEGNSRWMTLDNRAGQHHGFATSPLLADGKLIAYMHELLAFDAASGRQEWVQPLCPKPADQWAVAFQGSLCALRIGDTDLFMTPNGTILRVSDGATLYANPAMSGHFQAPTPVVEGRCVVKLNTDGTLFVLKLPETLAGDLRPELVGKVNIKNPAWRLFLFDWHMASPLLHEGLAYCLDTSGVLTVVDVAEVRIVYQKLLDLDVIDGLGLLRPSLCLAGGRIHALGSAGTMVVFEPGRTFRQLAKNRIAGVGSGYRPERFTATPVFDRDRIYVRGERALYCIRAASAEALTGSLGASNAVARVGREGWFCVRSRARLDELLTRFKECGWEAREGASFAATDFSRELVLGCLREGDAGERFECRRRGGDAARTEVELLRRFVPAEPGRDTAKRCAFILVAVPRSQEVAVRLSRLREGADASAEPVQEVGRALAPDAGDVVDGLRVAVRPEKDRMQAGEDIRIEFRLEWEDPWIGRELSAVPARLPVHVWDATFSKGYRNHAFLVETPDGRNLVLQRPEVGEWFKNAPHPEAVAEGEPRILRDGDGQPGLSLRALGLRTDQPGDYRITGLYRETAEETAWQGRTLRLWGGSVAGNTVIVRVLAAGG